MTTTATATASWGGGLPIGGPRHNARGRTGATCSYPNVLLGAHAAPIQTVDKFNLSWVYSISRGPNGVNRYLIYSWNNRYLIFEACLIFVVPPQHAFHDFLASLALSWRTHSHLIVRRGGSRTRPTGPPADPPESFHRRCLPRLPTGPGERPKTSLKQGATSSYLRFNG